MRQTFIALAFLLTVGSASAQSVDGFSCDVNKTDDCLTNARAALTAAFNRLMSPGASMALKARAGSAAEKDQIRESLLRACTGNPNVCRDFAQQTIGYLTDESVTSLPNLDAVKKKYVQAGGAGAAAGRGGSNPLSLDRFKNMKQSVPLKKPLITARGGASIGAASGRGTMSTSR